jgi:hypothetical protein
MRVHLTTLLMMFVPSICTVALLCRGALERKNSR